MGEFIGFMFRFFHESKPALGMMTLVITVVLTLNWVQTLSLPKDFFLEHNSGKFTAHSEGGWIRFVKTPYLDSRIQPDVCLLEFPYWSIVWPLTILSAYLILSKPRQLNQNKITEPASDHRV